MMFMNLNSKDKQYQGSLSPKLFLKSNTSTTTNDNQIMEFMTQWTDRLVRNDNTISYETENYAKDKKNVLQNHWNDLKNKLKHTFVDSVYTPLTFYEFHLIDHLHKLYNEMPFQKIAASILQKPFIPNFMQILKFTREITYDEDVQYKLKKQTVAQLDNLIKKVQRTKFASDEKADLAYTQMQTNIILMILTFKMMEAKYNPYKRRIIKRIFNQLSSDNFMNTMQTLRYLENERPEVQLLPHLSQQEVTSISNNILMKTYDKYHRRGTIPKIHLKKVSQNERRKVVNLLISGFLSQDQDKKTQWKNLLSCMPDSQVYGLDWESQTINKLMGFMAESVKDLIFTEKTLEEKFVDNPFNPAFDVAQQSGRYLAHVVHDMFPNQFINIIGYSLGTQLIKQFIKTTLELNGGRNLQRVVLMGGVSDSGEFDQILNQCSVPLSLTNMFTANDSVLQILLKRCRKNIQPIGLKQLVRSIKHCIDNTDVSQYIMGHLAYMTNFGKIADLLELSEE